MQTLIFAFGCGSWPFRWMNRYPVGFWAGPTRFLLVFHAISTQILKCCLCAIFRVYYLSLPFSIFFPAVIWSRLIQCRLPVLCRLHLLHLALFLCVSVDRSCLSRGNLVLRSQPVAVVGEADGDDDEDEDRDDGHHHHVGGEQSNKKIGSTSAPSESNSFAASARRKLDTGHVANDARLAVHLACDRRVHHLHRLVRPLRPQPPGNAVSGRVADVFAGERRHCGFEEILQLGELSFDPLFSGEVGVGSVASFFTGDRIIFLGL